MGLLALAMAIGVAVAIAATSGDDGIGPKTGRQVNGRVLKPLGTLVKLGNFPTGAAVTPDGRYYWTVSTGRGRNDIRIVSVAQRRVVQVVPIPGASGGIVMDPVRKRAYVSGVADSDKADQERPGLPGRGGDVVHVFSYSSRTGKARFRYLIPTPPPADAPLPQNFPPTNTLRVAWPDRLAIARDGSRLLVPLNLGDAAAIVDLKTRSVRNVKTGSYPYGAAILRDGKTGLVSNEATGTVSVIDLQAATKLKDIQVGPKLSHPEAITVDPRGDRAYVAVTNSDQVAVIDASKLRVERTLSVGRPEGLGVAPVALAVTPDGRSLLVAEAGADELAVFRLPRRGPEASARAQARARAVLSGEVRRAAASRGLAAGEGGEADEQGAGARPASAGFDLVGRIPVASYPTDVEVTRATRRMPSQLLWTSGKGLGVGPNPRGPDPTRINDNNANSYRYLPAIVTGRAGLTPLPTYGAVRRLTPVASRALRPDNRERAPAGTPLRAGGPIKYVFYVVRENRTYDQVLGDESRGDGDPKLSIFGRKVTPNMHALVERFGVLDRVFANSEASIDGHFWTSAAKVSDYVNKNWFQNYAGRNRPYDFGVYEVTWPAKGFLFDQAERQGISYFNYGEAVAGVVPLFPDKDRTPDTFDQVKRKFNKSDLGNPVGCYPNDAYIARNSLSGNEVWDSTPPGTGAEPKAESRFDCFKQLFSKQLAAGEVPRFNYLTLTSDHTRGASAGERTPRAMVAENDYALGQVVDLISKSPIWKQSAIFVVEDDSQDGADHVDAHRIPAAVISPYARRGGVVSTRYDFLSVIRSMELILGMRPLGLFDRLATPMYDAFTSKPRNTEPFSVLAPTWPINERNPSTGANARRSAGLDFSTLDQVPQRTLDRILWKSVKGETAVPPPPGPNAVPGG